MLHVGCGGEVTEDASKTYKYEGSEIPAYRCVKRDTEILGDYEIELDDLSTEF